MPNTLVLLDTGNLHYGVNRKFAGRCIDYAKLYNQWAGEDTISIAYGTIANDRAYGFRDALRHYGFIVKFKGLNTETKRYNPIVDIVLEAVNHVDRVNTIILGSSNKAFLPLIQWLRARSIEVGIWASYISYEMKEASNFWREIDEEVLIETNTSSR